MGCLSGPECNMHTETSELFTWMQVDISVIRLLCCVALLKTADESSGEKWNSD